MGPLNNYLNDYFAAFLGGILVSFTPCIYPLIPISASYIGIKAGGSKIRGLILSLSYISGIAITYSALGLVASLSGTIFGSISSHPLSRFIAGILIIFFGLSMLDLWTVSLPNIIKKPVSEKKGYFSAFILGLVSGLIVSPCLTPVLGTILIYLAVKKDILYGMTLLFSFAYGMGIILILIGTFSSALLGLPKSGRWMLYIKRICAFILIGMGIYFIVIAVELLLNLFNIIK
ncbi:MAG: cytochrome c biogenesis protein CcdA [Candidatus Omnitrophota bacterium]|nr:cytochrome c biogenesis protein CcdA [Candidatus Omnitrophota bacterium]